MSEDLMKRLAVLEAEVSRSRAATQAPQLNEDAIIQAFVQRLIHDPIGTLTSRGAPVEHLTRVFVANAMGDQAPQELKMLAAQGPQVIAARAVESKVEALSRQFSNLVDATTKAATRESFKALTSDKSKYPHLAKAAAADPDLIAEELGAHGGTAEELAAKLEARLTKVAAVYAPPPASGEDAVSHVPSTQDTPAGVTNDGVPPIPKQAVGVFRAEDHAKLRDEIVRKHTSQA
jgi:hypothetical protein